MSAAALNRRDWFRTMLGQPVAELLAPGGDSASGNEVAVIAGRNCLAYQNSFCSTCVERCPVENAITSERGLPRINPVACTGCGECAEVCPAPVNAIMFVPRRPTAPSLSP